MIKSRVLLLTQWFDPEPTFKGMAFARELVRQGFDVEVLTGFPNYPGGKVYPGYSIKWLQRDVIEGVHITRVPLYPNHNQSVIKRVLNYTSFAASAALYGVLFAKRPNVIYAYHPPLTVGIAAAVFKLFRRVPVVYDIQDMWPDTLRTTGVLNHPKALELVAKLCRHVYRQMDHIVVLSPGFKLLLIERGVPESKLSVIYNWADETSLSAPVGRASAMFPTSDARFRILFAGNMGKAQALETVLDAAELLQRRGSQVCWVMLGSGLEVERLKTEANRRKLENVVFLPAVPMAQVGAYLQAADALLVHLRKDPLFKTTIPSKTQAYMAIGKPLLMAVEGDAAELVHKSGGGVVAEPENGEALAEAAIQLSAMSTDALFVMGQKAKYFYHGQLNLNKGVKKFAEIFQKYAPTNNNKI